MNELPIAPPPLLDANGCPVPSDLMAGFAMFGVVSSLLLVILGIYLFCTVAIRVVDRIIPEKYRGWTR